MTSKTKSIKITAFLMKDGITKFEECFQNEKGAKTYEIKGKIGLVGKLFVNKSKYNLPKWINFFDGKTTKKIKGLFNSSSAALLLLKIKGRFFGITFGHGRYLIEPNAIDYGFGLRTALNLIDPTKIRSIDLKTYEDLVLSTKRQSSQNSQLGIFGMDTNRDLMKAVVGEPKIYNNFGKRIAGADSFSFKGSIILDELGQKLADLLDAYKSDDYKEYFDWIDHLKIVRDKRLIQNLEDNLLSTLNGKDFSKMYLAPPEFIQWDDLEHFEYFGFRHNQPYDDLDINDYVGAIPSGTLTIEDLKKHKIGIFYTGQTHPFKKWSLYHCLIWETEMSGHFYSFIDGEWFEISKDFAMKVKNYVKAIPNPSKPLPDAKLKELEKEYNERIVNEKPKELYLFDRILIRPTDAGSLIEFCDILGVDGSIYHLKRKIRSATLSHLFAQGLISGMVFAQDAGFQEKVKEKINGQYENHFKKIIDNGEKINPRNYEVVFGVISKPNPDWPESLPFFSQLNLRQHRRQLELLGYKVSLQLIEEK